MRCVGVCDLIKRDRTNERRVRMNTFDVLVNVIQLQFIFLNEQVESSIYVLYRSCKNH